MNQENQVVNEGSKKKAEGIPEDNGEEPVESSFIPAYMSATENEPSDLNRTELNTEYNTSRPLGGQTERQGKGSTKRNQGAVGGLTDRDRQLGFCPMSEVQSTVSYQISQSTLPRVKKRNNEQEASDDKDNSSLSDDLGRGSPRQEQFKYPSSNQKISDISSQHKILKSRKGSETNQSTGSFVNETVPDLNNMDQPSTKTQYRKNEDYEPATEIRVSSKLQNANEENK